MADQEAAVDRLLKALADYEPDSREALQDARVGICNALGLLGVEYSRVCSALEVYATRRAASLSTSRGILRQLEQGKGAAAGHVGSPDTPR